MMNHRRNSFWKKAGLIGCAFLLVAGCQPPVQVTLHDATDGKPVAGALVERNRKPNLVERTINPIGAFYHPYWTAQSVVTDKEGRAFLKRIRPDDRYHVVTTDPVPVRAVFGDQAITLRPGKKSFDRYLYVIRPQHSWQYTVSEPWFDADDISTGVMTRKHPHGRR